MSTPLIDLTPINAILARLETVADRLEKGTGAAPQGGIAAAAPPSGASAPAPAEEAPVVAAFDGYTKEKLDALQKASDATGVTEISDATKVVVTVFGMLRSVFSATGKCKKPADTDWQSILKPIMELGQSAQKACDNRSAYFHNAKSAAESMNIIMMVCQPGPADHCQNVLESMDFHAIKVMQKKIPAETAWINALKDLIKGMKPWCLENIKMGLSWKAGGEDAKAFFESSPLGSAGAPASAKAPGKGKGKGAPPPPKADQIKAPPKFEDMDKPKAGGGGMAAVFGEINKFSTGGLKKVTDDMKTKNRDPNEKSSVVTAKSGPSGGYSANAAAKAAAKKPPKMELVEGKWYIENYENDNAIVLDDAEMSHLICIINCKNSVLKVNKRVKSVIVDGCTKFSLVVQDVISCIEYVNCDRNQCQILGSVKSVAIDKCNGLNVYLSKDSLDAEVTSAKSCEMNLNIPHGDEFVEVPIPEQFVTKITPGTTKITTEVSGIYA